MSQQCSVCQYWRADNDQEVTGDCRRKPPTVVTIGFKTNTQWPKTQAGDWCGEFITRP